MLLEDQSELAVADHHNFAAAVGVTRLRHIYLVSDACPIPRPLLVHWPQRGPHLSLDRSTEVPGYIPDIVVRPDSPPAVFRFCI